MPSTTSTVGPIRKMWSWSTSCSLGRHTSSGTTPMTQVHFLLWLADGYPRPQKHDSQHSSGPHSILFPKSIPQLALQSGQKTPRLTLFLVLLSLNSVLICSSICSEKKIGSSNRSKIGSESEASLAWSYYTIGQNKCRYHAILRFWLPLLAKYDGFLGTLRPMF